ncbi:hypothetical protein ACFLSA_01780 [Bacteroidota bacterium]
MNDIYFEPIIIEFSDESVFSEEMPQENEEDNKDIDEQPEQLSENINYSNYAAKIVQLKNLENKLYNLDNEKIENADDRYKEEIIKKAIGEDLFNKLNEEKSIISKETITLPEKIEGKDLQSQNKKSIYSDPSTITYDLENRYSVYIPVPVYKCQFGGQITMRIHVNRRGLVSKYEIIEQSKNADCIKDAAIESINNALFNMDEEAPELQEGTINYTFIPQ